MSVAVAVERRQIELAKRLSDGIHASGTTSRRRNYTGLESSKDRFFYGLVGEAAVVNWLRAEGVTFRHRMGDGRGANEIHVWHKGVRRSVDVKTASQPHHRMLMIPAQQVDAADFYIAVKLENDPARLLDPAVAAQVLAGNPYAAASIVGWLDADAVAGLRIEQIRIRTRVCDFINLRSPGAFIAMLDKGGEIRE